ncbi:MAG: LamG domain-containing protein, partial [Flavobacteriales bacterium]
LLLLAPCALLAQVPDYVPTDGLVAYWPLDGHILDATGNHDGTNSGAVAIEDQSGIADQAMALPAGNDFFDLPGGLATDSTDITLSFWAWLSVPSSGAAVLLDRPSVTDNIWSLDYQPSTGTIHFVTRNDDGSGYQNIGNWAMPSEQWTHITTVFRKDSDSKEIYANGELVDSASALFDGFTLPPLRFGEAPEGNNADCRFSDIGLWTRALSPAQIAGLHSEVAASPLPDHVPTDGLVAYWPLDGDATNAHGADYDGNIAGATPTNDRHGEESSAFAFDGVDDQIIIPNDFNFAVLTVSAWFYRSSQADTYQAIVDRSLTNNIGWWIEESQVANEHLFFTGGVASGNYFTTTASLPDFGEWTHVCATYEAGHQELYLNGVLTSTDDNALPLPFPDVNLYIGSRTSTAWFHGAIDDVGIWNRALTTEEIGELYSESTEAEPSTENLALEFSGISDYLGPNAGILEIPFADALDRTGSDPFTIASDVLFDADGFPYALFHTGQDGDPENSIRFNISTSELEFMWENTGTNYKLECALPATTVGILDTGVWHNIAA